MYKLGGVPERVDYRQYATHGYEIEGTIPLVSLPRVVAATHQAPAEDESAQLQLAFAEDAQRRVCTTGRARARLVLQCQRCTALFVQPIDAAIAGVIVTDDDAAADVPRADEPIMAEGAMLDVHALVEDELLLALPIAARCGNAECRSRYEADNRAGDRQPPARNDSPFAVLQELKRGSDSD